MQQDNYVDVIPDFVGTSGRSTLGKQIQILFRVDTTLTWENIGFFSGHSGIACLVIIGQHDLPVLPYRGL